MLNKMQDKMFNMLAMCIVLYPCRIDESLEQSMKEKVTFDKLNKMQGKTFTVSHCDCESDLSH